MTSHLRTMPVLDANGDQLTLYEVRDRASLLGFIGRKRLMLCTGEAVKSVGRGYVVVSTGEKLTRLRNSR